MNGEDVGGRKKGEVNEDGENDDNDDNDDDDDDNNSSRGGRKRARFDPSRDTVLVVPDRCKLTTHVVTEYINSGFAATPDAAGNTKKVETVSPLSAALVLKVNFIESLPNASRPFLTPLGGHPTGEELLAFIGGRRRKERQERVVALGGRAGCVALIANAFVNRGGLDLLSSNLGGLDESFEDELTLTLTVRQGRAHSREVPPRPGSGGRQAARRQRRAARR